MTLSQYHLRTREYEYYPDNTPTGDGYCADTLLGSQFTTTPRLSSDRSIRRRGRESSFIHREDEIVSSMHNNIQGETLGKEKNTPENPDALISIINTRDRLEWIFPLSLQREKLLSRISVMEPTDISHKNWYTAYFFWEDSIEIEEKKGNELYINMIDMPWRGREALLFILRYALEKNFYRITLFAIPQKEVPHVKRREKILIDFYYSFWFKNDSTAPQQYLHPLMLDLLDEKVLTILIRRIEQYRESGKWEGFPIWFSPSISLFPVENSVPSHFE